MALNRKLARKRSGFSFWVVVEVDEKKRTKRLPMAEDGAQLVFQLRLPLPHPQAAVILLNTIAVDAPLPQTTRRITIPPEDRLALVVTIEGTSHRAMRVATHAVMEQLDLALRTLQQFHNLDAASSDMPRQLSSFCGEGSVAQPSPLLRPSEPLGSVPPMLI